MDVTIPVDSSSLRAIAKTIPQAASGSTGEWLFFVVALIIGTSFTVLAWHALTLWFERRRRPRVLKALEDAENGLEEDAHARKECREDYCSSLQGFKELLEFQVDAIKELMDSKFTGLESHVKDRLDSLQKNLIESEKRGEVRMTVFTEQMATNFRAVYKAIDERTLPRA